MRLQDVLLWVNSPYFYFAVGCLCFSFGYYLWLYLQDRKMAKRLLVGPRASDITIDGVKIHYESLGEGRPIVCLHGIGASVFVWRLLTPLLARRYKVITLDLPGFGRSDKSPSRSHGLDAQT